MGLIDDLTERQRNNDQPFLIGKGERLTFADVLAAQGPDLSDVQPGDVVALIGDFDSHNIAALLRLIDLNVVLMPLTAETRADHAYYFDAAGVDIVIEGKAVKRIRAERMAHPFLEQIRLLGHPGFILFSSGTTGRPKAILHDFSSFLTRYSTPRPALRTLNFLLFDHIGGVNTLLHTLYNNGVVVAPSERTPQGILKDIDRFNVEVLPTTPTFLRMMLMSGLLDAGAPPCLKIVTYGTERMDQGTLDALCALLPTVDFRQTFGMSELGILRVKSQARGSLWMKVGGEGVETKVVDGVLKIRAAQRMLGYLNAPSPFDDEGWYDTKDLVETDGPWIKVVGRTSEVISVGGIKFLPSEIERAALMHSAVADAKAVGKPNPITGQHVELTVLLKEPDSVNRAELRAFLEARLPSHLIPHRIVFSNVPHNHRFKKI